VLLPPSLAWYPSAARGRSFMLSESLPQGREPRRMSFARSRQCSTMGSVAAGRATDPTPASRAGSRTMT
jgi:hypothetical protein